MYQFSRRGFLASAAAWRLLAADAHIRLACQTRSYGEPPRALSDLLSRANDMALAGFQGLETNQIVLQSIQDVPAARKALEDSTPLIGLHLGVQWQRPEQVEKVRVEIARVARGVRDLGGKYLVLSGAASHNLSDEELRVALRRKAGELVRAAEECRKLGVGLSVHNHVEECRDDFRELREVLRGTRAEDVSLILDIAHAANAGADAARFVREHALRIAGFHVRDWIGEQIVPMGTGKVDLAGWAQAIRDTKWTGWVIVELDGKPLQGMTSRDGVRQAKRYLGNLLHL